MFFHFGGYQGGGPEGWSQCALQCRLECGMRHVGSPPVRRLYIVVQAAYQGSHFSRMPPILRWTPPPFAQQYHWGLCTTNTYVPFVNGR